MKLINFLKANPDGRKIFGKKEISIIEKQINGIKLTQSEKNRLSRDVRKKLKFMQEASKFKDEFNLEKGSKIKEIIQETKKIILKDKLKPKIKEIILFGSSIKNKRTKFSDIDFAVKFNKISTKEATLFRKRILGESLQIVDIEVYNLLPEKIRTVIDKEGKIIYGKK